MELLLVIDALKRSSAKNITAVIPYFGYARQDRKVAPRTSISAKLVSNLITKAGADRVVTVDLHAGQIQGFFDIPVDNLFATPIFARHVKKNIKTKNLICVSPDVGGVERTRALARKLDIGIAIIGFVGGFGSICCGILFLIIGGIMALTMNDNKQQVMYAPPANNMMITNPGTAQPSTYTNPDHMAAPMTTHMSAPSFDEPNKGGL